MIDASLTSGSADDQMLGRVVAVTLSGMTGDLRIPFEHEGRDGEVIVHVRPISTGAEAGFDVLPDLPFVLDAVVGYPSMSATLAYEGGGYRELMGWVQVVGSVRSWGDGRVVESSDVDLSPAWFDVDLPFFVYGYSPSIYDAPARNLNGASRLDWCAETFLTTVPRRTRSEPIRRLASFSWGYSETDASAGLPSVRTPREIGADAWTRSLDRLRERFPRWAWA